MTAEYESRKPASKITEGRIIARIKAEARTELIPFTGLFIMFPAWRKENISVALRTEGVRPVTKANDHKIIKVIKTLSILSLRFIKKSSLKTNRLNITA
jgi:hypothetical protein